MMSTRALVLAGVGATTTLVAVVIVVAASDQTSDGEARATQATATTRIVQQDLVEQETVDGTLGYSDARAVINRRAGTVTWTPPVGSVVATNHRLYEVDGEAVYVLDGAYPAYREMGPGVEGRDVLALERNLRALGLDPDRAMRVDGSWDAGTTAATRRWQQRKGLAQTGSIEVGRIVFQPGPRRVGSIALTAGSNAGGGGASGATAAATNAPAADRGGSAARLQPAAYREDDAVIRPAVDSRPVGMDGSTEVRAADRAAATTDTASRMAVTPPPAGSTPQPTTPEEPSSPPDSEPSRDPDDASADGPAAPTPQQPARKPAAPAAGGQRPGSSAERGAPAGRPMTASPGATSVAPSGRQAGTSSSSATATAGVSAVLMTTTSTKRIVAIDLPATKQSLATVGAAVTVEFPDDTEVPGRIVKIGRVAQKKATATNEDPPATIKVVVKLRRSAGTGLDQAPVDVRLTKSRARSVLTVPVTALIAQQGGSFAVEVRDGAQRRVVRVQTGLYTDAYVEIRGPGLRPGMRVTNARV